MHRAVLQACLPWFFWLFVASVAGLLILQFCGGRVDWRRLRRLGSCEDGAVQSLSLVLTLPVFILIVLFIVQISQIMIAIMVVNYSAFAGARAASVWIPADVTTDVSFADGIIGPELLPTGLLEPANVLNGFIDGDALIDNGFARMSATNGATSAKYQKVVLASIIPIMSISPSANVGGSQLPAQLVPTYHALVKLYPQFDTRSRSNKQMPQRLLNKLSYASSSTTVDLVWQNISHPTRDILEGPTYNPYMHPAPSVPAWNPNEIGFRDPITVVVTHQFVLLPGIGRILSRPLDSDSLSQSQSQSTSTPASSVDRAAKRITRRGAAGNEVYTIQLEASATFVNEGYKSVMRYAVQP